MKKILILLLSTTLLSFADIYKDACEDFDKEYAKNKSLTILDYAEGLSARTNQARNANKHDEADRLLKLFAVTVSTGLEVGINNNPTPDLVARVERALDKAYSPLSKKGLSSNDLTKSLDDAYESSRTKGTLDQYAAVVEHSYHAVGLHKIKPWDSIPNIEQEVKKTKPSELFTSTIFEKKDDKPKPAASPSKLSTPPKLEVKPGPMSSKSSLKAVHIKTIFKGETTARKLSLLRFQPESGFKAYPSAAEKRTYEKYTEDQKLFQAGQYPYKHLEEDLEAVKGLQEINIDSLMEDEVITDIITFYKEKPSNDKQLGVLRKELEGYKEITKIKGPAYEHHKPKIEELQQKIKEGSKYKDGITYLKESGSPNFNKGVEALLKVINYKGDISKENKYKLGKWILGNKILNLSSSVTKDVNLKKAITNIFLDRLHNKKFVNNELAQVLFEEGILAVQKVNMSTQTASLVVDVGNHFTLKEHAEYDVYLEFDEGIMGRLTTVGGTHFYPATGLKLSDQEQKSLEKVIKDSAGH